MPITAASMETTLQTFRSFTSSLLNEHLWRTPQCVLSRRYATKSSSSTRWMQRQSTDSYSKAAKLWGFKSRAAFKLLEINTIHNIFKKGQTVVDLGFAPGSWSQVAIDKVSPGGRVVGVDIIPALPPKGVSTFQGDFLSPRIQKMIRDFLSDPERGRPHESRILSDGEVEGYIDRERRESAQEAQEAEAEADEGASDPKKMVNVVLSDMCEPWFLQAPNYVRSLIIPWHRMMNTSGIPFRDHAKSMDLCNEALLFCLDVLRPHGHFVCKFYAGAEDKALENRLKKVFEKVIRDKPNSSRKESREVYFVCLRMKRGVSRATITDELGETVQEAPFEKDNY